MHQKALFWTPMGLMCDLEKEVRPSLARSVIDIFELPRLRSIIIKALLHGTTTTTIMNERKTTDRQIRGYHSSIKSFIELLLVSRSQLWHL